MEVAAGGVGGRASDLRGPKAFGDEVDDALRGLEGPSDAEDCGRLGEEDMLSWRAVWKRS